MTALAITSEVQKLAPSAIIEVFEIDGTAIGADVFRFHAGSNQLNTNIVWQGETYVRFPIEASGFEISGQGQLPRPKLRMSNLLGAITTILLANDDMIGAKFTRKRTLAKYLDAANFPGGVNASADATAEFPDDVFFIDRKVTENRDVVEFELCSTLDLAGVRLPRRQIVQNLCVWVYRGAECGYDSDFAFTELDVYTDVPAEDKCGKRVSSCKVRFGLHSDLPFGGMPGSGLIT